MVYSVVKIKKETRQFLGRISFFNQNQLFQILF